MAANRGEHRIEVVLFDAMYCLFEAQGSRAEQLARIFKEEAGIDEERPRSIWRITQTIRNSLPPSSDYKRDWVGFNRRIIAELTGCEPDDVSVDVAERIQRRILWDATLYEVRNDIKHLLRWLARRPVKLGIASNQDRAALNNMLRVFGVDEFFHEPYIFTSDRIAEPPEVVSKPHERFWRLVQEMTESVAHPERVVFIGNSLRNDAPATRYGHPVLLFDRCGHQKPLLPSDNPLLQFCQDPEKHIRPKLIQLGLP